MTRRSLVTAGLASLALAASLPSVASATDYCVGAPGCAQADTVGTLEQALSKAEAAADADRILVGPGEYRAKAVTGFSYGRQDGPLEIVGAGRGQTVLTGLDGGSGNVLFLNGGDGTSIHDLTIRIPANVAADYRGLTLKDEARRIEVVQEPGQSTGPTGVLLVDGGILSDSTVTLTDDGTVSVEMQKPSPSSAPNVIRGSTVTASNGVQIDGGGRIERSYVVGDTPGVYAKRGLTEIEDSLIRVTSSAGTDVFAAGSPATTSLRLDGDTLVGIAAANTTGVRAATVLAPDKDINIDIRNSVLDAVTPLLTGATGPGRINIIAAFSAYDPTKNYFDGVATVDQSDIQRADPGFVDAAGMNFRLRPDSPLVDAGAPDAAQGTDLDGNPLVQDGNGDGIARRDIGAYELAVTAPQPQADTQAPVISRFRARRSSVSYRLSERARIVVKVQRRLAGRRARYRTLGKVAAKAATGPNHTRVGARLRRKEARPGRYRAVIVAVDAAGNRSAPKRARFRVRRR